jgi:DtxR family Mn-dependent transcriptional regulator
MVDVVHVTRKEAEYLTFLYRRQIEEGNSVSTMIAAKAFNVQPATVTECFKKLAEKHLVEYQRYYGVKLTEMGRVHAEHLLRKHRLLETLYVEVLGYSPPVACQEASRMDYDCSDALSDSICGQYDHPRECPCNKTIFHGPSCGRREQ